MTRLRIKCFFFFLLGYSFLSAKTYAQKTLADSVAKKLVTEITDKGRVLQMWTRAKYMLNYDPDSAQLLSQQALYLARNIGDPEGESRSLGILASSFTKIGNY